MGNLVCIESLIGISIWRIIINNNLNSNRSPDIYLIFFSPYRSILESFEVIYSLITSNLSIYYLKIIKYLKRHFYAPKVIINDKNLCLKLRMIKGISIECENFSCELLNYFKLFDLGLTRIVGLKASLKIYRFLILSISFTRIYFCFEFIYYQVFNNFLLVKSSCNSILFMINFVFWIYKRHFPEIFTIKSDFVDILNLINLLGDRSNFLNTINAKNILRLLKIKQNKAHVENLIDCLSNSIGEKSIDSFMLLSRFLSQNIKLFLISLRSFITCHDNKSIKHFPHTINLIGNFSIGELILENDGDSRITINKQKVSKYLSFLINKESPMCNYFYYTILSCTRLIDEEVYKTVAKSHAYKLMVALRIDFYLENKIIKLSSLVFYSIISYYLLAIK